MHIPLMQNVLDIAPVSSEVLSLITLVGPGHH
jgi:hypothetical protein